jgi:hypothetical protein
MKYKNPSKGGLIKKTVFYICYAYVNDYPSLIPKRTQPFLVPIKIKGVNKMKFEHKRHSYRQGFNQPVSFETSVINGKVRNILYNGIVMDISDGGIGLKTDHALPEGSVLKFNIPIKDVEITIPVFAQVMWSKPDDHHFRAGLSFLM